MSMKKHWQVFLQATRKFELALHMSKFAFQGIYMSTSHLKIIMLVNTPCACKHLSSIRVYKVQN